MSRQPPLHISIPTPCTENWDLMATESNGRFCKNCQKTVIDFSYLSDAELYYYLKDLKTIPCGKFHKTQLNTPIILSNSKKKFWIKFYRPIAAALALFTVKNNIAATIKKEIPTTNSPTWKKYEETLRQEEKIIIRGTVKDIYGQPIENAEIRVGEKIITKSEKDGSYQFELKEDEIKSFLILISHPGLTTIVRNYHPAMSSTTFNIILEEPTVSGSGTIGAPIISFGNLPVNTICFKTNNKILSNESRKELGTLAEFMRNNPGLVLKIVAYPPLIKLNKIRQETVKDHLMNFEGIEASRLVLKMEVKAKKDMTNTIEIIPLEEE